jgi:transposase
VSTDPLAHGASLEVPHAAAAAPEQNKGIGERDNRIAWQRREACVPDVSRKIVSRPARSQPLPLPPSERQELLRLVRGRAHAHRHVVRSRIVLLAADGMAPAEIAAAVGVARSTVSRWCRRFADGGLAALLNEAPGRGRRPGIDRGAVVAVLEAMRSHAGAPFTVRRLAIAAGISASRAWRVLQRYGLDTRSPATAIDAAIDRVISETAPPR